MNKVLTDHKYDKLDLGCCQIHRDLYDKKFQKVDETLQSIYEEADDAPEMGDTVSDSESGKTRSFMSLDLTQETKKGKLRRTLYVSP